MGAGSGNGGRVGPLLGTLDLKKSPVSIYRDIEIGALVLQLVPAGFICGEWISNISPENPRFYKI